MICDDLARRLLRHLTGDHDAMTSCVPPGAVLVARGMGPPSCWIMAAIRWCALVLEEAAVANHVAVIARSVGLPMVASLDGIADSARGRQHHRQSMVKSGEVHLRPPPRSCGPLRKSARCGPRPRPASRPCVVSRR